VALKNTCRATIARASLEAGLEADLKVRPYTGTQVNAIAGTQDLNTQANAVAADLQVRPGQL